MIITKEISSFDEFNAWSGGKDTLDDLTYDQQEELFSQLEAAYPEGMTDDELNDFLWFERDTINEWLGIDEDGVQIGTDDWAKKALHEHFDEEQQDMYNKALDTDDAIDDYVNAYYLCSGEDDKDVEHVAYEFMDEAYSKWFETISEAMVREFPDDINEIDVRQCLESDNCCDNENMFPVDEVRKLIVKYIEDNKEDERVE